MLQSFEMYPFDVPDSAKEILEAFRTQIEQAKLSIKVYNDVAATTDPSELVTSTKKENLLSADWNLYSLTLFHLIANAIKYTEPSGGENEDIAIRISLTLDKDEFVLSTEVIDKGEGIEEAALEKINK